MTTNIYPDHYTVADIIADVIWTDEGDLRGTVTEAAQALADDGRLMPDLPDPNDNGYWWLEHGRSYDHVRLGSIYEDNDRVIVSGNEGPHHISMALTRDEARGLALALLAAADYAERNQE